MPVLTATGAGVRHRRRWLFRDLDATVEPGELVAVVGVPGSGRTTVLLALARRFRLSAGKVDLSGTAALGYVPDVEQPEPVFSVAEHVRERLALLGRPARDANAVLSDGLYGLDPALKGWQLTPFQKQILGLALARMAEPAVIVLDGLDDGLDSGEQAELWRILGELSAAGVAVVVTAREVDPARVATVIRLGDPQANDAASPQPEPVESPESVESTGAVEPQSVRSPESVESTGVVQSGPMGSSESVGSPESPGSGSPLEAVEPKEQSAADEPADLSRPAVVRAGASRSGNAQPANDGDEPASGDREVTPRVATTDGAGEESAAGAEGTVDGEKR